jgi:molybdopterin converting factor small subunit
VKVRIIYTGRSYHVAESFPEYLELEATATVDDALRALGERLPADAEIPCSCLVSVGGKHLGTVGRHESPALSDGDELTFIAPVAGG